MGGRGLPFNAHGIRAILAGEQTQTRRLIRPQYGYGHRVVSGTEIEFHGVYPDDLTTVTVRSPFAPGDVVYAQEVWAVRDRPLSEEKAYYYKVDGDSSFFQWQSSWSMPIEAARIFLRVTDVRPDLLRNMTIEDARAEGFERLIDFYAAWDVYHAGRGYGWLEDPWVWTYKFEVLREEDMPWSATP